MQIRFVFGILLKKYILILAENIVNGTNYEINLGEILNDLLSRFHSNPGFLAKLLTPPSEEDISDHLLKSCNFIIPENIYDAREQINKIIAISFKKETIRII